MAINPNEVTDEQVGEQIDELNKKADRTEEDNQTLGELKKERQTRYQKRIDQLSGAKKAAEEEAEAIRAENERLKAENETFKTTKVEPEILAKETVAYGNQKYYTDKTLTQMVQAKQITEDQAYAHQSERNTAKITEDVTKRLEGKTQQGQEMEARKADAEKVLKEYPHFDTKHAEFNAKDPLYIEANRIYDRGYKYQVDGMSLAIADAKKILGIQGGSPDVSGHMSLHPASAPGQKSESKEIKMTEDQKDIAVRTYRDQINPKTGRNYTENESIEKMAQALASRRA